MSHRRAIADQAPWTPLSPKLPTGAQALQSWYDLSSAGTCQQDAAASFERLCCHCLSCTSNATLQTGDIDFEVGCWASFKSNSLAARVMIAKDSGIAGNREFTLFRDQSTNLASIYVSNDGSNSTILTASTFGALALNTWYFVRAWHDAANNILGISVNGIGNTVSYSAGVYVGTSPFFVGAIGTGSYMDGSIDSAYFTKRVSTTAEATALATPRRYVDLTVGNGLDTFASNLTSWWDLSEWPGSLRYDAHGTNHLTETFGDIIGPTTLNGGFETLGGGGADVFANWAEYQPGSSTIVADTAEPYAGTNAAKINIDSSNSLAQLWNSSAMVRGKRYIMSARMKGSSGSPTMRLGGSTGETETTFTLTTNYALYSTPAFTAADAYAYLLPASAASKSIWVDNVTLRSAEILSAAGIALGPAADTNPVARLLDVSGLGHHLTQTDMTKRLVYRTAQQNGRPALVGVGGDDSLSIASDLIGTGDVTVCAVFNAAGWGAAGAGRIIDNSKFRWSLYSPKGVLIYSNAAAYVVGGAGSLSLGTTYVLSVTATTGGLWNIYVNGVLSGSPDQTAARAAGTSTFAANDPTGVRGFNGNIYEILIFSGILNAADIAALTAYERTWWGF